MKYYCSTVTVLEVFSHNTLTVQCAAHCVPNAGDTSNNATTADNTRNANTDNNTVFIFYSVVSTYKTLSTNIVIPVRLLTFIP